MTRVETGFVPRLKDNDMHADAKLIARLFRAYCLFHQTEDKASIQLQDTARILI